MKCSKCPGDECSGLCSLFEEFDTDGLNGLAFESPEIDDALVCRIHFESNVFTQDNVKIEDPTEKNKLTQVKVSSEEKLSVKPDEEEQRSERKRKNEKNRRSQLNEGFDGLAKLIFHIDPQLKAAAQARAASISKSKSPSKIDDTKLLGRVELVNTAVATLRRIHQEDEFHKSAIAQYATGQMPSILPVPNFDSPSLLELSSAKHDSDSEGDETQENRAVRKRKREKKRRDSVNAGLDQLMNLIFLIDPEIKVAAEEKAQLERSVGGRNSSNYILSRVELMNIAVATMARSHQDNEVHRSILAHLSDTHNQLPSVSLVSSDATEASVDTNDPLVSDTSDTSSRKPTSGTTDTDYPSPPPEVSGLLTSSNDLIVQPLPLVGEQQVDERALISFLGEIEQFAGFDEATDVVESSAKRLKVSS